MRVYNKILQIFLLIFEIILSVNFTRLLKFWVQAEKLSLDQIEKLQNDNLNVLLNHAITTVPAYITMPTNSRLCDFPIVSKLNYRNDEDLFISNKFNKSNLIIEKSSGSSGFQGKVYMTKKESYAALAHQTYLWSWSGYKPGFHMLQLGMTINRNLIKYFKDLFFRINYAQAFNLDRKYINKILENINSKSNNIYFGGYASGLYEFALAAKYSNINNIHFKSVISWGDKMFDHYRKTIESQFNTKVFDTYGCTEGLMIAGQCEYLNYHILTPHVYLEILDDLDNPVPDGEIGNVVVTRLDAYAMPLIRYRLGDLAIKAKVSKQCMCGKPFPMLEKIIGRDTDIIKTPSGKTLIVHFFTAIFEHISEIKQFQVIQFNISEFEIHYISEISPDAIKIVLDNIHLELEKKVQEKLKIQYVKKNSILATPSGKPQIIVSHLQKK